MLLVLGIEGSFNMNFCLSALLLFILKLIYCLSQAVVVWLSLHLTQRKHQGGEKRKVDKIFSSFSNLEFL